MWTHLPKSWKISTHRNRPYQWMHVIRFLCPIQESTQVKKFCSADILKNDISSDFGRGTIKFQSVQNLLQEKDDEKFRSLTARMSCLMTIAEMRRESEVSKLIDIINELKMAQKYLIVFVDTLNITLLHKQTINFNVIINHRKSGMTFSIINLQELIYIRCFTSQMEVGSLLHYVLLWARCMRNFM